MADSPSAFQQMFGKRKSVTSFPVLLCSRFINSLLLLFVLSTVACNTPSPTPEPVQDGNGLLPLPTARDVPPTFTPSAPEDAPPATALPTREAQPTAIPNTPIAFEDVVITAHLRIPAIQYDRRLEGNIGSDLILIDETAAKGQQRSRQAFVLIELQQSLSELTLAPLPDGCDQCAELTVTFPLEEVEFSGWLEDPILLASLENLFTVALGPHFSPEAQMGLRRGASPFAPAQTLEVDANGTVWIWQANQSQVVSTFAGSDGLLTAVSETVNQGFAEQYAANCDGVPIETLMLQSDAGGKQLITIACPAFTLPLSLLPLYVQVDALMNEAVLDALPAPETGFPLTAVLQYQREDGIRLIVDQSQQFTLENSAGEVFTDTLSTEQISGFTTPLIEAGTVSLGLTTFASTDEETENTAVLFIRGLEGVYDGAWENGRDVSALEPLNRFIDTYLGLETAVSTASQTPTATATANTPAPDLTPTTTPTP